MLYMSMHAEAVVDLVETEGREVQFRQVQGDFSVLQGKFMLQEGTPEVSMHLASPSRSCIYHLSTSAFVTSVCCMLRLTLAYNRLDFVCHC